MRVPLIALVLGTSLLVPAHAGPVGAPAGHSDGTTATRTNDHWSGYSAHSSTYSTVSASWTEPSVDCRTGGEVVFWVGLDGDGNDNVEQTGTHVLCRNGRAVHTGWWETYPCYNIIDYGHPVRAGDKIDATVTDNGNGTYRLYLRDETQGWTEQPDKRACSGAGDVSAEVITETPIYPNGPSALANFGTVTYTNVSVNGRPLSTAGPQAINMVRHGRTIDTTSAISGGTQFSNTWLAAS
ncbi:G1 family glutamic endopeptidase [Kutzneria kofuensis]|uniref:Peptidase A4-like protein n=1 Tax=Kutzneria kofuensis TaxID=103725 RepID=A0A7W9NJM7_9PSEU|nr:G1 family glutamic endopeptidase [Kutzneria kofuensis]MBB5895792.1 hypothetical protein [Kutzneria kofuensis]